jgi:3-methyladenine DNA glycosylase/8-oxoguanine DNA glycosylase
MKRPRYGYDPAEALAHLQAADPAIKELIARVGPFALELHGAKSLLESMLRSIIYQQLHGKAAAAIHGRVLGVLRPLGGITHEAIERAPDTALRAAGLSAAKLLAIRDLAAKCREGTVPTLAQARKLGDDELVERLTSVRGIGPWTVHMLLIFQLGRPDVMPTGDFAIRLAFKKLYRKRKDPSPAQIVQQARRWRPYRSIASWYLWRSLSPDGGT